MPELPPYLQTLVRRIANNQGRRAIEKFKDDPEACLVAILLEIIDRQVTTMPASVRTAMDSAFHITRFLEAQKHLDEKRYRMT